MQNHDLNGIKVRMKIKVFAVFRVSLDALQVKREMF